MIITEIRYRSLNFKVPRPHRPFSWRSNEHTWPLGVRAFYRILTMVRTWQEPPRGGGGGGRRLMIPVWFSKKPVVSGRGGSHVPVGIILSWLCSGGSRPSDRGGGGSHPDPEIREGGLGPSVSVSTHLLISYPDLPLFNVTQSEIWVRDYPSFCCLPLFRLSYVGFPRPFCWSEFYPNTHGSMPVLSWD